MDEERVIVIVRGGVVVDVIAPQGVEVIVRDYDTDGIEPEYLLIDDDGDVFTSTHY